MQTLGSLGPEPISFHSMVGRDGTASPAITTGGNFKHMGQSKPRLQEYQGEEVSFKCGDPCVSDLCFAFSVVICSALKFGKISTTRLNKNSLNHLDQLFVSYMRYFSSCLGFLKQEKQCYLWCGEYWYKRIEPVSTDLGCFLVVTFSCVTLVLAQQVIWPLSLGFIIK